MIDGAERSLDLQYYIYRGDVTGGLLLGFDLITTDIGATNPETGEHVSSSDHSNNRGPYVAPQFAYIHKVSNWTFGAGVFAQAGVDTLLVVKHFPDVQC